MQGLVVSVYAVRRADFERGGSAKKGGKWGPKKIFLAEIDAQISTI
jgi:hypothetical protein